MNFATTCLRRCRIPLLAALLFAGATLLRADEYDDLRLKWRDILTGGTNLDLGDSVVQSRLASIANTANSRWSTLNTNAGRTNLWADAARPTQSEDVTTCFSRLRAMALAWATRGCSLETNTALAADIVSALDWMYANKYNETITSAMQYDNWWDWQIGSPQHLNNTAVLMFPVLSSLQISNYNQAVDNFNDPGKSGWMTGANTTDKSQVCAIRGILGKNAAKIATARDKLSPVFPYVASGDGFYTDGSFIQHTRHPYTGSYGSVLMDGISKILWLLDGSTWQVTDPARANVFRWVYDSYEPVIYKGATMNNLRGRAISRQSSTDHTAGAGNMASILQIAQFAPTNDALAFKRMLKYWIQADTFRNFTNNVALSLMPQTRTLMADTNITPRGELIGHYRFNNMDRVVHLRPGFGFAISMSSSRIYTYESINQENLHGWFTGDGMTTLYNNDLGQFAGNFWPTVDPYHLPGTTVDQTTRANGSGQSATTGQNWVGGASLPSFGVTGMSLDAQASSLVAKKSWFMFDNEIVCLGAGITCGTTGAVHTTAENRRLGATATNQFIVDGVTQSAALGWGGNFGAASWAWLAGVGGYYFPGGANLQALREARTNSWWEINQGGQPTGSVTNPVTEHYLTLWFDHGLKPTNANYAYTLLPNLTASQASAYSGAPDITVITNTTTLQAVKESVLGIVAANFWNAGTNTVDLITTSSRSSVMTRETNYVIEAAVSDPTQTNTGSITITLNRAASFLIAADAGITVQQLSPQIRFAVAVNGSKGKTYRATFSTDPSNPNPTWDANLSSTNAQDGSGIWSGAASNWWNGVANVPWNDAASPIATFGNGGTAGTVTVSGARSANSLVFNPTTNGTYTLTGSSPITLGAGIAANQGATLNVPLTLAADQLWTVASANTLALGSNITASAPFVLALSGGGEFRFTGGTGQLPSGITRLNFSGPATISLITGTQTIPHLALDDNVSAIIAGAGALTLNGASDRKIGGSITGASQTLDLSGLASFTSTAPASVFSVGGQTSTVNGTGTLRLATNSCITAKTFGVQNVTGSTGTQSRGTLILGQNTTINTDTGQVGWVRDNGTIQFASGTASPTLTIRGADGAGRTTLWTIGSRSSSFFTTNLALVDLVSGFSGVSTLDAMISTLEIADEAYNLTAANALTGRFIMGGGTLDALNILLGAKSSASSQSLGIVNATLSQTNGGTVQALALMFGDVTAGNTGTLNSTYELGGGGTLRAQLIQPGNGAANRQLIWSNGTIRNYDAARDLSITLPTLTLINGGLHCFDIDAGRTANVSAALTGTGSLTKSGAGTLHLSGASTHSGIVIVSNGTLRVTGSTGTNSVTVVAGAFLGGTGVIRGPVTLAAGGSLSPGASVGTLTVSNHLTLAGNLIAELDKSLPASNDLVIVSGTLTNAGAGAVTVLNLGPALVAGDCFKLFSKPVLNGGAVTILSGGGVTWSNRLALDGTIEVISLVNTTPTNLLATLSGANLMLSWPADHIGWRLEVQTNTHNVGLQNNWFNWPGATSTNSVSVPHNLSSPAVFFRLAYP